MSHLTNTTPSNSLASSNSLANKDDAAKSVTTSPTQARIAYVQAGWHREIVEQSLFAFKDSLAEQGIAQDQVDLYEVPGSLEIPLQCKLLANSGKYSIIVAAGLIVDGGIYRHDFVAATVLDAMMQVQLASETPILSVVLTPHLFSEAQAHHDFFFEHFKLKGAEAASACIKTLKNISTLKNAA